MAIDDEPLSGMESGWRKLKENVLKWSGASQGDLGKKETQAIAALVESGNGILRLKAIKMIHEAGVCPLLVSYSSDGTPL